MSSADFAPVNSELISVPICRLSLGHKGYSLTKVKFNVLLGIHTLDFDQTNIVVLVTETTLVAKNGSIYMKTRSSRRHDLLVLGIKSYLENNGRRTKQRKDVERQKNIAIVTFER
jgi:hypothetical protein